MTPLDMYVYDLRQPPLNRSLNAQQTPSSPPDQLLQATALPRRTHGAPDEHRARAYQSWPTRPCDDTMRKPPPLHALTSSRHYD
jgi:hypothetical protein